MVGLLDSVRKLYLRGERKEHIDAGTMVRESFACGWSKPQPYGGALVPPPYASGD